MRLFLVSGLLAFSVFKHSAFRQEVCPSEDVEKKGCAVKLLIIDSNKDWVEMLTGWLKSLGFEVYRAYSGEKAKIQWMEYEPDLVILDASLPDLDALAMCQEMH